MSKDVHDVCKTLPPTLTVIDAFVGLRGKMPASGEPVKLDTVIASTDTIAADSTAARIMGFNPEEIDHINWAYKSGFGEVHNIEVVGSDLKMITDTYRNLTRYLYNMQSCCKKQFSNLIDLWNPNQRFSIDTNAYDILLYKIEL